MKNFDSKTAYQIENLTPLILTTGGYMMKLPKVEKLLRKVKGWR